MTMAESPHIEQLKRRVQMDPASIAFAALAEEYRKAGRVDEAIATCVAGLKRHPSYVSARVTLGRALVAAQRDEEARREFEAVLRSAPDNLVATRALADIAGRRDAPPPPAAPEVSPEHQHQLRALETFLSGVQAARRPQDPLGS